MHDNLKAYVLWPFYFFVFSGLLFLANFFSAKSPLPDFIVSKQQTAFNFNPTSIQLAPLGHARLLSSILWITTIIESDLEHYQRKDHNSWMFLRFKSIAELEPNFYKNYLIGGQYLAIVKDDLLGADALYRAGLSIYSDDFWLRYHAGHNAAFELGDLKLASEYLTPLLSNPITFQRFPQLLRLINKIKYESGDIDLNEVYEYLTQNYQQVEIESVKRQIFEALYSVRSELDLACLNSDNQNCNKRDLEGNWYQRKNGVWVAPRAWKRFELYKKGPQK